MNVLTIFDQRIGAIFENGAPGERVPFSFKRLAKRAVREMENETFVIDGVDTAPALYTILVSSRDDYLMRPMYVLITNEISQLIEAQAKKRGYTFVGKPLVRFMVDPALRGGKFTVFAENIDPRTLARLRDEENAYLGITSPREIVVEQGFVPEQVPVHEEEPAPVSQEVAFEGENLNVEDFSSEGEMWGDDLAPEPTFDNEPSVDETYTEEEEALDSLVMPEEPEAHEEPVVPVAPEVPVVPDFLDQAFEASAAMPAGLDLSSSLDDAQANDDASEPEQAPMQVIEPSCTVVNMSTGQSYHITSDYTLIGRERITGSVVVRDPNASRRHAELLFDGTTWRVRDLRSTNGTLVNDIDVPEAILHDGDVLTIGLTNLEFRLGEQ